MQECKQNAQECAHRLVLRQADQGAARDIGEVGASAQELPICSAIDASFARALGAALDRQMDERFAVLNPTDGRLVSPRLRPHGVLWRFHAAVAAGSTSSIQAPAVGAAVAPSRSGARS